MIRKWIVGIGAVLVFSGGIGAAENDRLFLEGNRQYQAGNYPDALANYDQVLRTGYESGPLYFNMGNCHYKLGDIGRAVLFYERAKRLMPRDEDVKANLSMANLSAVDQIEPQADFLLVSIAHGLVHWIPRSQLSLFLAVFYVFGVLSLTVWIVSRVPWLRNWSVRLSILFGVLFVLSGLALFAQIREMRLRKEAVILAAQVDVQSAPGAEGLNVFALHAGTKVRTDQQSGDWIEIILPDRKVGWVRKEVLEAI